MLFKSAYLGDNEIVKAYKGSTLFYEKGGLPSGYTALEYLESSGTQAIDTGYKPNSDTRLVVDCLIQGTFGAYGCHGVRDYTNSHSFWFGKGSTAYNRLYGAYNNQTQNSNTNYYDARHTFDFGANKLLVDNVQVLSFTAATFSVNYNLFLFAVNDDYQSSGNPQIRLGGNCKTYSAHIYENDVLTHSFVPCLDNNNVPCMYDLIGRTTHYNIGTGNFTYGGI